MISEGFACFAAIFFPLSPNLTYSSVQSATAASPILNLAIRKTKRTDFLAGSNNYISWRFLGIPIHIRRREGGRATTPFKSEQ